MKNPRNDLVAILAAGMTLLVGGVALAGESDPVPNRIVMAIKAFVEAADSRDVAGIEAATHRGFRVAVVIGQKPNVALMDRETYLQLIRARKIGGDRRTVSIRSVELRGHLAVARVRLEGEKAIFEGDLTLLKDEGTWKVYQDASHFRPKAKSAP